VRPRQLDSKIPCILLKHPDSRSVPSSILLRLRRTTLLFRGISGTLSYQNTALFVSAFSTLIEDTFFRTVRRGERGSQLQLMIKPIRLDVVFHAHFSQIQSERCLSWHSSLYTMQYNILLFRPVAFKPSFLHLGAHRESKRKSRRLGRVKRD
jgi:hypothetical protein